MDKKNYKKRILIVSHALELGGAERSLIGFLNTIDTTKYSVDLFLLRHEGELLNMIPKEINLLPEISAYTVLARPMVHVLKEGHVGFCIARLYGKIKAQLYDRLHHYKNSDVALEYSHKYTCRMMPQIQPDTKYDVAISFLTPHYFVIKKVKADRKIAWIHTDYSTVSIDRKSEFKMWKKYDDIIAISEATALAFKKIFPELKEKIAIIENIIPKEFILKQAEDKCKLDDKFIKLVSVGRFCTAKNFDSIPDICFRIRKEGMNIKWYLIGFGPDEDLIKRKIREMDMQEYVIILGKKSNPYPYIKECDLYVQPSRYEGKCVAVKEAQLLRRPVVITNYATSFSQLENGEDGIIVPMDNCGCADAIVQLLKKPDEMKRLSNNCRKKDYSNAQEIKKFYQLIGEI